VDQCIFSLQNEDLVELMTCEAITGLNTDSLLLSRPVSLISVRLSVSEAALYCLRRKQRILELIAAYNVA